MVAGFLPLAAPPGVSMGMSVREVVSASRTYYVATAANGGSDNNDGRSTTTPWLTIQHGTDYVSNNLIIAGGVTLTISVGAGTFTGSTTLRATGGSGTYLIVGAGATTIVSTTSASCFVTAVQSRWQVRDMTLQTTTSGDCLSAQRQALILFQGLTFGACAGNHIRADRLSEVEATGNYSITGSATQHWLARNNAVIQVSGVTVTLTGTPAFTTFASIGTAKLEVPGTTFSGTATGTRYLVFENGVIATGGGGATYLPGNVAGSAPTGGQYT